MGIDRVSDAVEANLHSEVTFLLSIILPHNHHHQQHSIIFIMSMHWSRLTPSNRVKLQWHKHWSRFVVCLDGCHRHRCCTCHHPHHCCRRHHCQKNHLLDLIIILLVHILQWSTYLKIFHVINRWTSKSAPTGMQDTRSSSIILPSPPSLLRPPSPSPPPPHHHQYHHHHHHETLDPQTPFSPDSWYTMIMSSTRFN